MIAVQMQNRGAFDQSLGELSRSQSREGGRTGDDRPLAGPLVYQDHPEERLGPGVEL